MINDVSKMEIITKIINKRHHLEGIVIIIDSLNIPISTSIKRILINQKMRLFIFPPLSL